MSADRVDVCEVSLASVEQIFAVIGVCYAIYFLHVTCGTHTDRKTNYLVFIKGELFFGFHDIILQVNTNSVQTVELSIMQENVAFLKAKQRLDTRFQIAYHLFLRLVVHKLTR